MNSSNTKTAATAGAGGAQRQAVRRVRPSSAAPMIAGVVLALCALLLAPTPAAAEISGYLIDTGPLRIRDQFFLGMGFLAFDPVSADVLENGEWQVDLIETASNDFVHSDVVTEVLEERTERAPLTLEQLRAIDPAAGDSGIFFADGELYRTAVAVRRGIGGRRGQGGKSGRGIQLELVVPVLSFQGGFVDSVVEQFHDTFGFEQTGRQGVPKDSFTVYARSGEGEVYFEEDPGLVLGDIVLGAKFRLRGSEEERLRLAIETQVKLATGGAEPLGTSGSTDVGAQLLLTRYYSKACVHGSLGLLALGSSDRLGVDSQTLASGMVAYERGLGPAMTWLAQVTVSQSPFADLDLSGLDRTSQQVTLGIKKVIKQKVLFVGVTENFGTFNNTPDIGLHVGLTRGFGKRKPAAAASSETGKD